VRKLLSILLLALFALPLAAPLLAMSAQDDASLPACCRRNGAHHCSGMMADQATAATPGQHFAAAYGRCPSYPAAIAVAHTSPFVPGTPDADFIALVSHPANSRQTVVRQATARNRSRPLRGPPLSSGI
jgi:hypothetical protein